MRHVQSQQRLLFSELNEGSRLSRMTPVQGCVLVACCATLEPEDASCFSTGRQERWYSGADDCMRVFLNQDTFWPPKQIRNEKKKVTYIANSLKTASLSEPCKPVVCTLSDALHYRSCIELLVHVQGRVHLSTGSMEGETNVCVCT